MSRCSLPLLVALAQPLSAVGQSGSFAFDTVLARRYFQEAAALIARDRGALWHRSLEGPLLLAEPRSRALLAAVPDSEGRLLAFGAFFSGQLPPGEAVANAALRWAGRSWAMAVWPLPADSLERAVLLGHELWHRIQDSLGFPGRDPPNPQLATRDGRLWLRMEGRALQRALERDGAARLRALRDALLFRRARRRLFPAADSTERQLELNEGLAEYSGVALATSNPEARRALVSQRLVTLDSASRHERNFAYRTGPAYGFFLDTLLPEWRSTIREGDDLAFLLEPALPGKPGAGAAAPVRAAGYGYAVVRREETLRAAHQHAHLLALRTRFERGPLLELPLAEMKLGIDPGRVETLDALGTVYGSLRLSDRWGVLQADSTGGLISPDWLRLIVPAPADTGGRRLAGPGWVLELMPGWRLVPGRRPGDWKVEKGEASVPDQGPKRMRASTRTVTASTGAE
jgi:hypothetical protein